MDWTQESETSSTNEVKVVCILDVTAEVLNVEVDSRVCQEGSYCYTRFTLHLASGVCLQLLALPAVKLKNMAVGF